MQTAVGAPVTAPGQVGQPAPALVALPWLQAQVLVQAQAQAQVRAQASVLARAQAREPPPAPWALAVAAASPRRSASWAPILAAAASSLSNASERARPTGFFVRGARSARWVWFATGLMCFWQTNSKNCSPKLC